MRRSTGACKGGKEAQLGCHLLTQDPRVGGGMSELLFFSRGSREVLGPALSKEGSGAFWGPQGSCASAPACPPMGAAASYPAQVRPWPWRPRPAFSLQQLAPPEAGPPDVGGSPNLHGVPEADPECTLRGKWEGLGRQPRGWPEPHLQGTVGAGWQ